MFSEILSVIFITGAFLGAPASCDEFWKYEWPMKRLVLFVAGGVLMVGSLSYAIYLK